MACRGPVIQIHGNRKGLVQVSLIAPSGLGLASCWRRMRASARGATLANSRRRRSRQWRLPQRGEPMGQAEGRARDSRMAARAGRGTPPVGLRWECDASAERLHWSLQTVCARRRNLFDCNIYGSPGSRVFAFSGQRANDGTATPNRWNFPAGARRRRTGGGLAYACAGGLDGDGMAMIMSWRSPACLRCGRGPRSSGVHKVTW